MNRLPPWHRSTIASSRESAAAQHRRQLLVFNRERIEFAYQRSLSVGMDDPVIVVLDLDDERAAVLAELTGLPLEQIEVWREECSWHEAVPTQILAAPRWAVLCVVGPLTPNGPSGIVRPSPPGTFRVVAVAEEGCEFADFPLPPLAKSEEE